MPNSTPYNYPGITYVFSPFDGLSDVTLSNQFVTAASRQDNAGGRLHYDTTLAKPLQDATSLAQTGLMNNLAYLGQSPTQMMSQLQNGQNEFYNYQKLLAEEDYNNRLGSMKVDLSKRGLSNSSTAGSMLARLAQDQGRRDMENRLGAIDWMNNQAIKVGGFNQGALGLMANIAMGQQQAVQNANMEMNNLNNQVNQWNANNVMEAYQADKNRDLQRELTMAQIGAQKSMNKQNLWGGLLGNVFGGLTSLATGFI